MRKPSVYLLLFLLAVAIRFYGLDFLPLDHSSWRQADTDSIARNLVTYQLNPLLPQLNYNGPLPNTVQLELQITTTIIALFYKVWGFHIFLARLVPLLFFFGSAYLLFLLVRYLCHERIAKWTVLVYLWLPLTIFFSRAIQPEAALMCFGLGAMYAFVRWTDNRKLSWFGLAALLMSLALLTKPTIVFWGIPLTVWWFQRQGRRAVLHPAPWLFSLIALVPSAVYFTWLGTQAEQSFVQGIASKHVLVHFYDAVFSTTTLGFFATTIPGVALTFGGLILLVVGLVQHREKYELFFRSWLGAVVLLAVTVVSTTQYDYYLMPITPVAAYFIARGFLGWWEQPLRRRWAIVLGLAFTVQSVICLVALYQYDPLVLEMGQWIGSHSRAGDLVIADYIGPEPLWLADRKGWKGWSSDSTFTADQIERCRKLGARWYFPYPSSTGTTQKGQVALERYLSFHYRRFSIGGYHYFELVDQASPSQTKTTPISEE